MEHKVLKAKAYLDRLLRSGDRVIVAIDGPCTAGKTTLAQALEQAYECNVFHMDDFFLQSHQRREDRYAQPGGNVDYERFLEEVLQPLQTGKPFSYRPFSCKEMKLTEAVAVLPKQLNIVEGTYSHHPYFGQIYDGKFFLTVDADLQKDRILCRPACSHQAFFTKWIPMETLYFESFQIRQRSDLQL